MVIDYTKCKCWIKPFEPPQGCFEYCTAKILTYAKAFELQAFFGFEEELAEQIFQITANDRLNTLSEFKPFLSSQQFARVKSGLKNISPEGQNWIKTILKDRMEAGEYVPAY